jgi:LuxR family maltose regulon positive regulatory protein
MDLSDVRERAGRPQGAGRPAFDIYAAKLLRPAVRHEVIERSLLIERLTGSNARPVVSVVAPAGYGKTTLLSQWAERNGQPVAWVSVDEADNDPKVLLTYVAEALDAVEPIGGRVFDALASTVSSVPGSVVPRLCSAFSSMTSPVALVLDDVHLVGNRECRAALSVLADYVPAGSRLVLAGRAQPPVRVARLRAQGRLVEVGPGDLALTRAEAAALLRDAGIALSDEDVAELHRRTEGWPAGLYLAALYIREGGSLPGAVASFGGDDRFVSEYVESEFLAQISWRQRVFLTLTAVLERMSGPLCEAVLDDPGSGAILADLARSNLLLVPLDHRGQWYRYHHLFRDMLLAELQRSEPGLLSALQRRAAGWYLRQDLSEEALEYLMAAGDVNVVAGLVEKLWLPASRQGRDSTAERWFRWLGDRQGIEGHPRLAVAASLLYADVGQPAEAERWADAVDRWQYQDPARPEDPYAEAWAATIRAILCRRGVEQMRADADEAAHRFAAQNILVPLATLMQGIARLLSGDLDAADALFQDVASTQEADIAPEVLAAALVERSLLAMARGDGDQAQALAGQADTVLRQAEVEEVSVTPLLCAVQARAALHRGDIQAVHRELTRAQRFRHLLTYVRPHISVQARIELARVSLALGDLAGAKTLMREVDELLRRRPRLGTLVGEVQALRTQISRRRGPDGLGVSALTAAELRLLPLLSTHLSFAEMGEERHLSPNTIKTQAVSIYRKVGATSRSQAVARARELGLLEG